MTTRRPACGARARTQGVFTNNSLMVMIISRGGDDVGGRSLNAGVNGDFIGV